MAGSNPHSPMAHGDDERGYRPTQRQDLLLRASLLDGEAALAAWREWKIDADIDRVLPPSQALLPLLYQNLLRQEVADPLMPALKKRYASTWYNNQILLKQMAGCLSLLHEHGIETVLLKGSAMILGYYRDYGVRPMGDVDVLVKPGDVSRAAEIMTELGLGPSSSPSAAAMRYMHSKHFSGEGELAVDLHWRLLWDFGEHDSSDDFWKETVRTEIHRVPTSILNATDQLYHVCVHGARWNSAPLRWVADAVTILSTSWESIDFERLAENAERHRVVAPVRLTLRYLSAQWSFEIPQSVLNRFEAHRTPRLEVFYHRYLGRDNTHEVLGNLPRHLLRYLRLTKGNGFIRRLLELPRFIAFTWRLEHTRDVPRRLAEKTARRIKAALRS